MGFKFSRKTFKRHFVIWLCLVAFVSYSNFVTGTLISKVIYVTILVSNFIFAYYFLLFFVLLNFSKKKYGVFSLGYLFSIAFFIFIDYLHLKKILPFFSGETPRANLHFFEFINSSLLLFSFVGFSSLATYLNWRSLNRLKQSAENEKIIILRELDFLKNQFNSHLTFNFFNFCYGKTFRQYPKVADSIENFSEMLRYSLNSGQFEYVTLNKEIDYIEHFIAIQKCITNLVFVEFKIEGNPDGKKISPMLLAVFIENAFKHGIFNDVNNPIDILLNIRDNCIIFKIKNLKNNTKIIAPTGICLVNLQQLLTLFYPKQHSLNINETNETYQTELTLQIF